MSGQTVVIKKYENRRLYDASTSRYVNLDAIAEMVREGRDLQVVEAKTGVDVTRQVLTQIIVEGAKGKDGGPPLEFLRELVRAGDRAQKDFLQWYLNGATEVYHAVKESWDTAQRHGPATRLPNWVRPWDPSVAAKAIARVLRRPQERAAEPKESDGISATPADADIASSTVELADLRTRLEELERKLATRAAAGKKPAGAKKKGAAKKTARKKA